MKTPKESQGTTENAPSRRKVLLGLLAVGAVAVEELTCGIGRRILQTTDAVTPVSHKVISKTPEPTSSYTPTECEELPIKGPLDEIINKQVENREAKRHKYTLHGINFASDTITKEELEPDMNKAIELIGGPYWQPGCLYVVEDGAFLASLVEGPPGAELAGTENKRQFMMSGKKTRVHELIHLLLGPHQDKWPLMLAEFFANAIDPKRAFSYGLEDTNHSSISALKAEWVGSIGGARTHFGEMRELVLSQLCQSLSNEKRIELTKEAIHKGNLEFSELPALMGKYGLKHAIFEQGKVGFHHHAFQTKSRDGRNWLLLVNYEATEDNEHPRFALLSALIKDKNGVPLHDQPIKIPMNGVKLVDIKRLIGMTGQQGAAFIEIPEWEQSIEL